VIDIKTLSVGDACPCATGMRIWFLDINGDQFCCTNAIGNIGIKHAPIPGGGYTNLTNVAVAPKPVRIRMTYSSPPVASISPKYPHVCPTCRGAVYIGFSAIEHATTGNARCP
jgi:hypothetical protein